MLAGHTGEMAVLRPRENRIPAFVCARVRTENGWSYVSIGNVSSRGLMLQAVMPMRRNDFIEVRHRQLTMIARVVWTDGTKCGVQTQDNIDIAALLSKAPADGSGDAKERRALRRGGAPATAGSAVDIADKSRRFARAFDWMIVAVGGSAAAAFVTLSMFAVLNTPLLRVGMALVPG